MENDIRCHCIRLMKTANHLYKKYDGLIKVSGLSANQFFLLSNLKLEGPCTTTQLAKITLLDRTTIVRNLVPLLEKGYLINEATNHTRNNALSISLSGIEKLKEANKIWKQLQSEYEDFIGVNDLKQLRTLLAKTNQF